MKKRTANFILCAALIISTAMPGFASEETEAFNTQEIVPAAEIQASEDLVELEENITEVSGEADFSAEELIDAEEEIFADNDGILEGSAGDESLCAAGEELKIEYTPNPYDGSLDYIEDSSVTLTATITSGGGSGATMFWVYDEMKQPNLDEPYTPIKTEKGVLTSSLEVTKSGYYTIKTITADTSEEIAFHVTFMSAIAAADPVGETRYVLRPGAAQELKVKMFATRENPQVTKRWEKIDRKTGKVLATYDGSWEKDKEYSCFYYSSIKTGQVGDYVFHIDDGINRYRVQFAVDVDNRIDAVGTNIDDWAKEVIVSKGGKATLTCPVSCKGNYFDHFTYSWRDETRKAKLAGTGKSITLSNITSSRYITVSGYIYDKFGNETEYEYWFHIKVQTPPSKKKATGKFNKSSVTIKKGKTYKKLKVTKMKKGDYVAMVTSSKKSVVEVTGFTAKGKITLKAKKKGSAKITATLASGKKIKMKVKVKK